eukprot:2934410-Rhodomonas_salina.1
MRRRAGEGPMWPEIQTDDLPAHLGRRIPVVLFNTFSNKTAQYRQAHRPPRSSSNRREEDAPQGRRLPHRHRVDAPELPGTGSDLRPTLERAKETHRRVMDLAHQARVAFPFRLHFRIRPGPDIGSDATRHAATRRWRDVRHVRCNCKSPPWMPPLEGWPRCVQRGRLIDRVRAQPGDDVSDTNKCQTPYSQGSTPPVNTQNVLSVVAFILQHLPTSPLATLRPLPHPCPRTAAAA